MNLFFDELSQKIIVGAQEEMASLNHPYVGSEHLFLSILKHTDLEITKVLNNYGITYEAFRSLLIASVGIGKKKSKWFLFTPLLKNILNHSVYYSNNSNQLVTPECILLSILQEGDGVATRLLTSMNVDLLALYEKFFNAKSISDRSFFDNLAINMNETSLSNSYDPVIGREDKILEIIQILVRKNKNNPLLIGEAGVGKTAIIEELAHRIAIGDVPYSLKNKVIYNISMSNLVAGTKYRGEFEEKIHKMIDELANHPEIILFIDEIHTIIGAGGAEGAIDASNILKPYIARSDVKIIGATTIQEYHDTILKDKAFNRRFQKVFIPEATKGEVYQIIKKMIPIYEKYHKVSFDNSLLSILVELSFSCLFYGRQPDVTINFLDDICSYVKIHNNSMQNRFLLFDKKINDLRQKKNQEILNHNFKKASFYRNKENEIQSQYNFSLCKHSSSESSVIIQKNDIYSVIYQRTGGFSKKKMKSLLKKYQSDYQDSLYYDKEFDSFLNILSNYDYIFNNELFSFLFIGKSDTIPLFLKDKLFSTVFNGCNTVVIDLKDYRDERYLSKLIGSSQGYIVHNDYYLLQSIIDNPFSILLFENIDQSCTYIRNYLLQSLRDGYFYSGRGEKITLKKCIVFMTCSAMKEIGFLARNTNMPTPYASINHIFHFSNVERVPNYD